MILLWLACAHQKPVDDTVDPLVWVRSRAGTTIEAKDVDWEFRDRLARIDGGAGATVDRSDTAALTETLTVPGDCVPVWSVSGPQEAVAVQPPFEDDAPDRIAATEAAIAGLLQGVEVMLACAGGEDRPVWAVNVHRGDDGWKFRAWRDFTAESAMGH